MASSQCRPHPGVPPERVVILSVVQLLAGLTGMVLGVVALVSRTWGSHYGAGLWTGACCVWAGIMGLGAVRKPSRARLFTFLALCCLATILGVVMLTLCAVGIAWDRQVVLGGYGGHKWFPPDPSHNSVLLVQCLLLACAATQMLCGTVASVLGCRWLCAQWQGVCQPPPNQPSDDDENLVQTSPPPPPPPDLAELPPHPEGLMAAEAVPSQNDPLLCPLPLPYIPVDGLREFPQSTIILQASSFTPQDPDLPSQLVYVLSAGGQPCPQPGCRASDDSPEPPSTPPPSYSTLSLHRVGQEEGEAVPEEGSQQHTATWQSAGGNNGAGEEDSLARHWDPSDDTQFDIDRLELLRAAEAGRRLRHSTLHPPERPQQSTDARNQNGHLDQGSPGNGCPMTTVL